MLCRRRTTLEELLKPLYALIAGALLCAPSLAARAAEPPQETRDLLTDATRPLAERDFSGVYTFRSRSATSKTNGDDREERDEVFEIRQSGRDSTERTLVRAMLNDELVTELRREQLGEQEAGGGGRRGPQMKLPTAEHDIYVFRALEPDGELCVSRYEPEPDSRDVDGATEGRIAWDCASGDPAWLEARFIDNPMFVDEFEVRWTFQRSGDLIVIRSNVFEVVAGLPFRKRKMEFKVELVDLLPGEVDVAGGAVPAADTEEGAARSE